MDSNIKYFINTELFELLKNDYKYSIVVKLCYNNIKCVRFKCNLCCKTYIT